MLKTVRGGSNRPATPRRRPFPLLIALLFTGVLGACASHHSPQVDGARDALRRTIKTIRPSSPSQARYLERLVADAEMATAAELSTSRWARQEGRAQAAWLRAVIAARAAMASHREVQSRGLAAFEQMYDQTAADVRRARIEIRETGMGRREGAAMERATVALATAERLAAAGEYERALAKLATARQDASVVHASWLSLHSRFSDTGLRRQWRAIAQAVIQESRDRQDFAIVVDKLKRQLVLYYRGLKMTTFMAELGANGLRRKEHAGDRATPEGLYRVVELKEGRKTKYYKALLIDYPNEADRTRFDEARRRGRIPRRAGIGGLIEIHGDGGAGADWTDGCVALSNGDMDTLFARVRIGTPVAIVGTHGN